MALTSHCALVNQFFIICLPAIAGCDCTPSDTQPLNPVQSFSRHAGLADCDCWLADWLVELKVAHERAMSTVPLRQFPYKSRFTNKKARAVVSSALLFPKKKKTKLFKNRIYLCWVPGGWALSAWRWRTMRIFILLSVPSAVAAYTNESNAMSR